VTVAAVRMLGQLVSQSIDPALVGGRVPPR
jgi:hypothetical protein